MLNSTRLITFTLLALNSCLFFPHSLVGHWSATGPDNGKVCVDFDKDSTFKVYTPASTENEGRYTFRQDTLSLYDKNCGMSVPGR